MADAERIADLEQQLEEALDRGAQEDSAIYKRMLVAEARIADLEKERTADEVRAQETIAAVRKRAELAERERDTAKSQLAEANERAESDRLTIEELVTAEREADAALEKAEARIAALGGALRDACNLAEEGWGYAGPYFSEKWGYIDRLAAIRAALAPKEPDHV